MTSTAATTIPRKRRRRLLLLVAAPVVLLVIVVAAGAIMMRTAIPRQAVIEALREHTGLRFEIGALEVGWLGESTARDVVVRLPDEDEPILTAPELRLHHAPAPVMLMTRDPGVTGATIVSPEIEMAEDSRGGWNLARAAACVREALSRVEGASTPRIEIENGTLHLRRYGQELRTLPVTLKIEPDGSSRLRVETSIGEPNAGESLNGSASVDLEDWTKIDGRVDLRDMDLGFLAPLLDGSPVAGRAAGTIEVSSSGAHPEAPVRISADLKIADGSVSHLQVGDTSVIAYAGRDRLLIERGECRVAGGSVVASSRVIQQDRGPFLQISVEARNLDVHQLVKAARGGDPASQEAAGRLDVRANLGRRLDGVDRLFGDASIAVREAELQPIPAFALLYSVLNIDLMAPHPTGEGQAFLVLEGDVVEVTRLQYFNRGTDINGKGRIVNVWEGGASPVEGALVATVRPLKGSKLPFGPELDKILGGLLQDAASVKVSGTLADPRAQVVPLGDVVSFIEGVFGSRSRE